MKKALIKLAVNGEYYIVLKAKNGRIIISGAEDTHKSKKHCINICKKHFPEFILINSHALSSKVFRKSGEEAVSS